MKSVKLPAMCLAIAVMIFSCGETTIETTDVDKLNSAISEFYDAVEKGDSERHASMFSENAIMLPNNWTEITGKEAVTAVVTRGEGYVFRLKDIKRLDMAVSDSIAYTINSYYYTYHPEGAEPEWHKTKNVHIWRLQPNGEWKLHADIWNSSEPKEI